MSSSNHSNDKKVAINRKARHDYFILDTFECGIVLTGTEIKSVRAGNLNLKDSYASLENGELWLLGVHISPYEKGTYYNHEPERDRKLLMHKNEILRLRNKTREKGLTLVPLSVYIKDGRRAKVELGLAKGRTAHDKRDMIADRDAKRTIARAVRGKGRDYED
ncbi:MAG: SsrA-binding protein SmpB [Synergistaceae bacterium]|nr:SsrA-binding protein SmpB [Synergistaceae bacterium]MBQ3345710.1 SsrA-binding protein SmpB [Synergistaceae bacterium]MBQ3399093.1 SsrA-binding protein SmpB [Synergistaceae bacterium]MBQ3760266.1 SsrA-binding protein SmpB [Synergistaceae bacterium]MBQ6113930.1 SsrA-binding protein SmpB [Synergistaceae bacterium]